MALVDGGSSWSCEHGVGRWSRDCGCVTGAEPGDGLTWRQPLREALDGLRDAVAAHYEALGTHWRIDPWRYRDLAFGAASGLEERRMQLDALLSHLPEPGASEARAQFEQAMTLQRSACNAPLRRRCDSAAIDRTPRLPQLCWLKPVGIGVGRSAHVLQRQAAWCCGGWMSSEP